MMIASAVSTRPAPVDASRSNPTALNIPHLVGKRADVMRQSVPVFGDFIVFALLNVTQHVPLLAG
jgi:hypothetical protein